MPTYTFSATFLPHFSMGQIDRIDGTQVMIKSDDLAELILDLAVDDYGALGTDAHRHATLHKWFERNRRGHLSVVRQ